MKRTLLATVLCFVCTVAVQAQPKDTLAPKSNWKLSGSASLTMTQSSYTNWAAGGENSFAGVVATNLSLKYAKDKWAWENTLDAAYGLMLQGSERSKTDDRFEFASKLGLKASTYWSYSALVQMKTQFDRGYKSYPITDKGAYISKFFSPGYVSASLGMDYNPNADFSLFLSPLTFRSTVVLDDRLSSEGSYGVDAGEHLRCEYGAFLKAVYQKKLKENILLKSKLELFSNLGDNPQNVDLNWEVNIDFKVTKWLSTKLYTQMLYDDDMRTVDPVTNELRGARLQFKEVLGIGLSYIF